jgi:hypothetical protein
MAKAAVDDRDGVSHRHAAPDQLWKAEQESRKSQELGCLVVATPRRDHAGT